MRFDAPFVNNLNALEKYDLSKVRQKNISNIVGKRAFNKPLKNIVAFQDHYLCWMESEVTKTMQAVEEL
jgi:hypothetical protein